MKHNLASKENTGNFTENLAEVLREGIASVQPSKHSIRELNSHIRDIAKREKVKLVFTDDPLEGAAAPEIRAVRIPKINSLGSYIVALHEIGHIVSGLIPETPIGNILKLMKGEEPNLVQAENEAWNYAEKTALEWTPEVAEKVKRPALESHMRTEQRLREAAKQAPPMLAELPPALAPLFLALSLVTTKAASEGNK